MKATIRKIDELGRVAVPLQILQDLKLKCGDSVSVKIKWGKIQLKPVSHK